MKPRHILRILSLSVFLGLAGLALPLPAHAGVHVSLGVGLPVPVFVAPAPVVFAHPDLGLCHELTGAAASVSRLVIRNPSPKRTRRLPSQPAE